MAEARWPGARLAGGAVALATVADAAALLAGGFAVAPPPVTGDALSGCASGMPLVLPLAMTAGVGAVGGTAGVEAAGPEAAGATGAGVTAMLAVSALLGFAPVAGIAGGGSLVADVLTAGAVAAGAPGAGVGAGSNGCGQRRCGRA